MEVLGASVCRRIKVASTITTMAITKIRTALSTVSSGMVRPWTWVLFLPRRRLKPKRKITAVVVVLIPPPQLPGLAPISMIIMKKNREPTLRWGTSTEFRPAVRLVKAMKVLVSSFSPKFRLEKVLFHSLKVKKAILVRTIIRVKPMAIRVWREILRRERLLKSNM